MGFWKPSKHEIRLAKARVKSFRTWDDLGKNTKLMRETDDTYQIRIWATLRVQFTVVSGTKEIVSIFKKGNHQSH